MWVSFPMILRSVHTSGSVPRPVSHDKHRCRLRPVWNANYRAKPLAQTMKLHPIKSLSVMLHKSSCSANLSYNVRTRESSQANSLMDNPLNFWTPYMRTKNMIISKLKGKWVISMPLIRKKKYWTFSNTSTLPCTIAYCSFYIFWEIIL